MKVATAQEMKNIDRLSVEQYGIPGIVLMENAGVEVARNVEMMLGKLANKRICVFAGKGNNGGDGFVVARHLHNKGAKVKIFLLGDKNSVNGDAKVNLEVLDRMGQEVIEVNSERDWNKVKIAVAFSDLLVDALLGTGFKGALSPLLAKAITSINEAEKTVIAIDIPSGVAADTGQVDSVAVQASRTVTFGLPKPGVLLYPGADCTGDLTVADIGIPRALLTDQGLQYNVITSDDVRNMLMRRPPDAHKGSCGKVLVIAGSRGLTGAAALTATAALRTGAGLVTLAVAESLHDIMEVKLTEVMTKPLPEVQGEGALAQNAVPAILELAQQCDILAIGPGLGRHEETLAAVKEIVTTVKKPLVVDADALFALSDCPELVSQAEAMPILTPHPGEMARLVGLTADEVNQDRIYIARQSAIEWGSIVILKGARTIVAFPDGEVYINVTGNSGMATGGTGDVLTGITSSLMAQGLSSHAAAVSGVYVHGMAGDVAAAAGKIGMTASDIIHAIPAAIYGILESQ